jgi:hypothetical protein
VQLHSHQATRAISITIWKIPPLAMSQFVRKERPKSRGRETPPGHPHQLAQLLAVMIY